MKQKMRKLAVMAGRFVFEAVIDKLVLAFAGLITGLAYKGLDKFREKRALKKAEASAEIDEVTAESKTEDVPVDLPDISEDIIDPVDETPTED